LLDGARENWRSRATNSSRLRAGNLTSCQGRAHNPPGQGSQKGARRGTPPGKSPEPHWGKMLRGWSVGIADFPAQIGSETTHVASTTCASRQGRRRKMNAQRVVNRPMSRSARPSTRTAKSGAPSAPALDRNASRKQLSSWSSPQLPASRDVSSHNPAGRTPTRSSRRKKHTTEDH
jgi:hypothetical protein